MSKYFYCKQARSVKHNKAAKALLYAKRSRCVVRWCRMTLFEELTLDHITPIAVAYAEEWPIERVTDMSNLQLLCEKHHHQKDDGQAIHKRMRDAFHRKQVILALHGNAGIAGEKLVYSD